MTKTMRIMMLLAAIIITAGQPAWAKDITINLGEGRGTATFSEASLVFSKCEALEVGFSFDIPLEVMTQSKTYGGVVMQNYTATLDDGVTVDGTLTGEIVAAASQTYTYTVSNNEMKRRPVGVSTARIRTTVSGSAEIATWSGFRKGAASFTFDDGAPSHVTDAAPVFDKYGYKATFNLVVNWNPNWSGFQGMADNGHEIASHSNSHGQNMSGEEASSKRNIEGKIKQKYGVITVAYPNCNVPSESAVLQNYIVGRICNGSWQGMSDEIGKDGPSNWAKVPANMTGSEGQIKSTNDFTSRMQKVVQSGGWVAFLTHGFQGKSNGNATYSPTDLNAIEGALKWAQENDNDIWVAPMGHVAMYIKERNAAQLEITASTGSSMTIQLTHTIADNVSKYDYPLSLRVKSNWTKVNVTQGDNELESKIDGGYIYFDAIPNGGDIVVHNDASKIYYEHLAADGGRLIIYPSADDASAANSKQIIWDDTDPNRYTCHPSTETLTDGIVYILAHPDFGHSGLSATITAEISGGSGAAQARLRTSGDDNFSVGQTIPVTAVEGHPGVYQFTMPDDGTNVTLSATFKALPMNTAAINYIDENGEEQTRAIGTTYVLDGTERVFGQSGKDANDKPYETWYVCNTASTTANPAGLSYNHQLKIDGITHLILADNTAMTVSSAESKVISFNEDSEEYINKLCIYGQGGTTEGKLTVTSTNENGDGIYGAYSDLIINGGIVNATANGFSGIAMNVITINGGIINATAKYAIVNNFFNFNGGQLTATSSESENGSGLYIDVEGIFGWSKASDYIHASSYKYDISVKNGQMFCYTDGSETKKLLGTLSDDDLTAIAGKMLRPYGYGGYCGLDDATTEDVDESKNVTWEIPLVDDDDDPDTPMQLSSTVTIEGTGDMADYSNDGGPWANYEPTLILAADETAYDAFAPSLSTGDKAIFAPSTISVTKNTSGWSTYCHGYPVTYSLEGGTAYTVSGLSNDGKSVATTATTNNVAAPATPLLLGYSGTGNVTLTALPATVTTVSSGAIVNNGGTSVVYYGNTSGETLMHATADYEIPALTGVSGQTCYALYNGNFLLIDTDAGIPAHRCILVVTNGNGARVLSIGDNTTEITTTDFTDYMDKPDTWYDLQGRRLDGKPTRKGAYIYNGKVRLVK